MKTSTWQPIEEHYSEFPRSRASGVGDSEIKAASDALGISFPADYREFLTRFGGGSIGAYYVAGLSRWDSAPNDAWDIVEQTLAYRKKKWPGTDLWAVFTDDGTGNPVGFDDNGRVWLSDHDCCEIVGLELSFEAWIRCWALDLEEGSKDYFDRYSWQET